MDPSAQRDEPLRQEMLGARKEPSPEEMAVFRECQSEAFFQRSLPFGVLFGGGAIFAMKSGHLSTSARFGYFPKALAGLALGYIIGKVSYVGACREKFLMKAPNSSIAQAIRRSKGMAETAVESGRPEGQQFGYQEDPSNRGDKAYDDIFSPPKQRSSEEAGAMSYDKLRADHRQKELEKPYMQQGQHRIRPSTPLDPANQMSSLTQQPPSPELEAQNSASGSERSNRVSIRTNKYGDEVFE